MFCKVNNKRHFECGTSSQNKPDQLKRSLELWLKNQCQGKEDFSKEEIQSCYSNIIIKRC